MRCRYNLAQAALIAAHVTLCREDELQDLEHIQHNLRQLRWAAPLRIQIDPMKRFAEGKGVMLPANAENLDFQALRVAILGTDARLHEAHITLLHPRNATCTDEIFAAMQVRNLPRELQFDQIHLISQVDGGIWEVLEVFPLVDSQIVEG